MADAKRGAKADATRRQLLAAALDVIGSKGYSAATVDEIVKAAGVSKGVAYYHFKNKAAMAESILDEGIGQLVEGFERAADQAGSAPEALTAMIELFAKGIFENRAFARFFVAELWREGRVWSDAMRGYESRLLAVLEGQIERGKREGSIRPEIDPAFEAAALVGLVLTTTLYYIGEGSPSALMFGQSPAARQGAQEAGAEGSAAAKEAAPQAGGLPGTAPQPGCPGGEPEAGTFGKDAFIERICDFVKHANARPEALH